MKVFCVRRNNFCGGLIMFCETLSARYQSLSLCALKTIFVALICLPALTLSATAQFFNPAPINPKPKVVAQAAGNVRGRGAGRTSSNIQALRQRINNAGGTTLGAVQKGLFEAGFYDDGCESAEWKWTGKFGNKTTGAVRRFVEKYPNTGSLSAEKFKARVEAAPKVCGAGRRIDRSRTSRACSKDGVGRGYLGGLEPPEHRQAKTADDPLQYVYDNFETIFPKNVLHGSEDGNDDPEEEVKEREVQSDDANERLNQYGEQGIDRNSTKRAINTALVRFRSLAFKYGFKDGGACEVCYMVNNWKYLKNIAQSTGGHLYHSNPKHKIKVNDLSTSAMVGIQDNVLIHRRITEKWVWLIEKGEDEYPIKDELTGKITRYVTRGHLQEQLRGEMDRLIVQATRIDISKKITIEAKNVLEHGKKLRDLVAGPDKYTCDGFDGSTIIVRSNLTDD